MSSLYLYVLRMRITLHNRKTKVNVRHWDTNPCTIDILDEGFTIFSNIMLPQIYGHIER